MKEIIQGVRFFFNFVRLSKDPTRLDLVFKMADGLDPTKRPELAKMLERPEVRRHLDGELPVPRIDLARLRALPEGSFGRAVAAFLDADQLDPGALFHTGAKAGASDFERFKLHMERSHDLWHVATGFASDVPGELGLQAFGIAQLGAPLGYMLLAAGFLHQVTDDRDGERIFEEVSRGWRLGKAARSFFGTDWEALYPLPLSDVRARLGVAAN